MIKRVLGVLALCAGSSGLVQAELISEFEPNPAGQDPTTSTFELSGTAGAAFSYHLLSIENDGFNGTVDRASVVSGVFDSNGLAVFDVPDLENPTFTVVLAEDLGAANVAIGTDLDPNDDGNLDISGLGMIFDAVSVSDATADDATLYAAASFNGTNILFNGEFEPLGVFRSASTGEFFQYVTVDFGGPNEHVGVFAANGGAEIDVINFTGDPTTTSFNAINPSFITAIPEPGSFALLAIVGCGAAIRRRKR